MNEKSQNKKKKTFSRIKLFIAVLLLFLVPFLLDRFIAHQCYTIWYQFFKIKSPMRVGEGL